MHTNVCRICTVNSLALGLHDHWLWRFRKLTSCKLTLEPCEVSYNCIVLASHMLVPVHLACRVVCSWKQIGLFVTVDAWVAWSCKVQLQRSRGLTGIWWQWCKLARITVPIKTLQALFVVIGQPCVCVVFLGLEFALVQYVAPAVLPQLAPQGGMRLGSRQQRHNGLGILALPAACCARSAYMSMSAGLLFHLLSWPHPKLTNCVPINSRTL